MARRPRVSARFRAFSGKSGGQELYPYQTSGWLSLEGWIDLKGWGERFPF
jgi:hypothetical protein